MRQRSKTDLIYKCSITAEVYLAADAIEVSEKCRVFCLAGPEFWGLVNPEWSLCSKGKRQSPVNIDPKQLLFDPHLSHVRLDNHRVSTTATVSRSSVDIRTMRGNTMNMISDVERTLSS